MQVTMPPKANSLPWLLPVLTWVLLPSLAQAAEVEATLDWSGRVELSAGVAGRVGSIAVAPGTVVEENTLLLQLEQGEYQSAVDHARARMQLQTRVKAEAQRELERTQELYDNTLISKHELEIGHIEHERALADYEQARMHLARAETELNYSAIRAPYKGMILQLLVGAGQFVSPRQQPKAMLIFARSDRMLAKADIRAGTARSLAPGKKVDAIIDGKRISGKVKAIRVSSENNSRLLEVELPLPANRYNPGAKIKLALP